MINHLKFQNNGICNENIRLIQHNSNLSKEVNLLETLVENIENKIKLLTKFKEELNSKLNQSESDNKKMIE